ncbi:MAG: 16S rRNA (adenine(1518)-N(6)/adenine(1519)-N(6))-dimethyltransferase RsmA [Actinomycetes bacterium]
MTQVQLLGATQIRRLAESLGVSPTKKWGQNFVIDPNTVRRIVDQAHICADDIVVEIGPGLGSLTLALLDAASHVVCVEIDPTLATQLPITVASNAPQLVDALTVITADAMTITDLGLAPTKLVANLPYNVAVPVVLNFLERFDSISEVLVMVQAEVADRLAAQSGNKTYGIPSLKAQWYGEVTKAGAIGRNVFWPAPNVDSGLVRIVRHAQPGDANLRREVFALVDSAFGQRRKTIRTALGSVLGSPSRVEEIVSRAGVSASSRGEQLTLQDFVGIALAAREVQ